MAYSTDSDLTALIPDILELGILGFYEEHNQAAADIERELRIKWWPSKNISGEMDATLLTDSQFRTASCYLVLWRYALPKLTNWVDGDRFQNMIEFYKARYGEEFEAIMKDGIEYDSDGDSVIELDEKNTVASGRLIR